jgi:hypothetical protein
MDAGLIDGLIRTYTRSSGSVSLAFTTGLRPELEEFRPFIVSMSPVVKGLPDNIEELLTPRALAYWIMDDGKRPSINKKTGRVSQGTTLCTDSYSKEQVEILRDA